MNADEIRATVLQVLGGIAPEVDLSGLKPQVRLRDQLDIDSMDFLNFVTALHARLGVNVPEADYAKVATIAGAQTYLLPRAPE